MLNDISTKLSHELSQFTSQTMLIPISEYLLKTCQDNYYLAEQILTTSRTLSLCDQYIQAEARKVLSGRSGYIADDIVYGMAEDFYYLSDEEITKLTASKTAPKTTEKKPAALSSAKPNQKTAVAQTNQLSLFDLAAAGQPTEPVEVYQAAVLALVDQPADSEPILSEEAIDHEQDIA